MLQCVMNNVCSVSLTGCKGVVPLWKFLELLTVSDDPGRRSSLPQMCQLHCLARKLSRYTTQMNNINC